MNLLLIDKPAGITSHDVIDVLRRKTGERTIGHAGTLDPFATGLLLVAVGREATKHLQEYVGLDKEYEAEIVLGVHSDTLDPEGPLRDVSIPADLTPEKIKSAMQKLTGEIEQIPPMHSAIKIGGKKLYELARKGIEIKREPRNVRVNEFKIIGPIRLMSPIGLMFPVLISCSSGTYIRALARDLGFLLGTEAYVSSLRRTKIGEFRIENATRLNELPKTASIATVAAG